MANIRGSLLRCGCEIQDEAHRIAWITPGFPFRIEPPTEARLTFGKKVEVFWKGFKLLKSNTG